MTNTQIVTESESMDSADAPAQSGTFRRLLAKRRSDRKGALGSTEMVQLIGVILLIAILAGGTFVYLRYIRGSSENSIVQRNVDEVAKLGDSFWQSYSADVDGRRKISISAFCDFANNQLAEEDLNLRTLQMVSSGTTALAPTQALEPTIDLAGTITVQGTPGTTAACWDDRSTAFTGWDILAEDAVNANADVHNAALEPPGCCPRAPCGWLSTAMAPP